jgi:multiple sugar transport system ATP-binding protein
MNFIDATVEAIEPGRVLVKLAQGEEMLAVHVDGVRLVRGQPVTLGIRPEHVRMDGEDHSIRGIATLTEQLGEHSYIHVDYAGDALVAKAPGDTATQPGERIALRIPADACHLFDADGIALERTVDRSSLPALQVA